MKKREQYCSEDTAVGQERDRKPKEPTWSYRPMPAESSPDFYRRLFEDAVEAILLCDEDGIILQANRQAVTLFGHPPQEMVERSYATFFSPLTEPLALPRLQQSVLVDGVPHWEAEIVRKDGTRVPVEVRAGVIPADVGQPRIVQIIFWDISQKKRAERQRADFLEMLAHDIRSPLSVVVGYTDLLLSAAKARASYEETDMLLSLRSGAVSLSTLVMNYLDLAKIEARPVVLAKGAVSVREVINRVGKQYEREAQRLQVLLDCCVTDDLPVVMGDMMALERVVTNLLHNALKFTPEHGRVSLRAFVRQHDEVVITVKDTGPGMTAEEIAVVFEKYRTTKRDRKREGSGLGLFIVKVLVEAHGGWIEVDSTPGSGTCMTVVLPVLTSREQEQGENL